MFLYFLLNFSAIAAVFSLSGEPDGIFMFILLTLKVDSAIAALMQY